MNRRSLFKSLCSLVLTALIPKMFANSIPYKNTPGPYSVQKFFTWEWRDMLIEMINGVDNNSHSSVYIKIHQRPNESRFLKIASDYTSADLFDFEVMGEAVYFSNGHAHFKWYPGIGISAWGGHDRGDWYYYKFINGVCVHVPAVSELMRDL